MSAESNSLEPKSRVYEFSPADETRLSRTTSLPPFEFDRLSRVLCIGGLIVTFIASIACVGASIPLYTQNYGFSNTDGAIFNSNTAKETISLILNIGVTLCTESLGFIHGTSLRWALYREGRLSFNSNIRLFTNAKQCAANSWYINGIWALLIAISYASASQVIQPMGIEKMYALNGQALTVLGISLFIQASLSVWCLTPSKSRRILSWNSSPLNTALALVHRDGERLGSRNPTAPHSRQSSAGSASKAVRTIVFCLWTLCAGVIAWGVTVWFVARNVDGTPNITFDPENSDNYNSIGNIFNPLAPLVWLAMLTAMQLIYTLALHAAEQIVNISRDEDVWRRAGNLSAGSSGTRISLGAQKAAASSWQTLALMVLKPVSHWLFGLSVVFMSDESIYPHPLPTFCLAGVCLVLSILVTYLGFRKPKGPQPTTFGDLKKLAEYIDDWGGGAGGRLYWGDKGLDTTSGARLAGTSPLRNDVGQIIMDGPLYVGLG